MSFSNIEDKFSGLWRRALNETSLNALTPELIEKWASEKRLIAPVATRADIGAFHPTPCIVLTVEGGKACFPTIPVSGNENWQIRRNQHEEQAALWDKVEWFMPLWLPMGEVTNDGHDRTQLSSMAVRAREALEVKDITAIADRGYFNSQEILACEQQGITPLVPKPLTSNSKAEGRFDRRDFIYIPERNEYECPAGQRAIWRFTTVEDGLRLHKYWSSACPHCQYHESQQWLERQIRHQVPGDYFMLTFTLPAQFRELAWRHQHTLYAKLFDCAWDTVRTFSQNDRQLRGTPGAVAVLHTHSRRLDYHPHVHLVMPAAALDAQQRLWRTKTGSAKGGRYLFNHRALAKVFRAKLLAALTQENLPLPCRQPEKWVVDFRRNIGRCCQALIFTSRQPSVAPITRRPICMFKVTGEIVEKTCPYEAT